MVRKFFENLRQGMGSGAEAAAADEELVDEYVELASEPQEMKRSKVVVRQFKIEDFSDVKQILDALRGGYTIALVNIQPLKEKDLVELKRAINKLKKTCDAINGDIAGFGDDFIVATPEYAEIYRAEKTIPLDDGDSEGME